MPISPGIIPTFGAGFGDPSNRRSVTKGSFAVAGEAGTPGRTVRNPEETTSGYGIVSSYTQGQADPYRQKLFGRLGPTSSHTMTLHPEIQKSFNNETGAYRAFQNPYVRSTDVRHEPGMGTAEGIRYWKTLRNEVSGANTVFDPLSGKFGNRNMFRFSLNNALKGRAIGTPQFSGYAPDTSWTSRLKQGNATESGSTADTTKATIETYEGRKQLL